MSGGCDTTDEDRERWRQEAVARDQSTVATAKEIERVAALLPPEESSAKRYLMGFAAVLRHRGR